MRNTRMKIALILSFALALVLPFAAFGQTAVVDQEVDAAVAAVDQQAAADPGALLAKLSADFQVALPDLQALLDKGYKPGELWLALELAKASGKSLTEVIALTNGKAGHGWGVVAQSLGIKPGSKEFAALRTAATTKTKGGPDGAGQSAGKATAGSAGKASAGGAGSGAAEGGKPSSPPAGGKK